MGRRVEPGAGPGERERLEAYEEAANAMMPQGASWYLGVLATDPDRRRQGLASAAIAPVLERADRDHLAAYLETGAPENFAFYARAGFEVTDEVVLPGVPPCGVFSAPPWSANGSRRRSGERPPEEPVELRNGEGGVAVHRAV